MQVIRFGDTVMTGGMYILCDYIGTQKLLSKSFGPMTPISPELLEAVTICRRFNVVVVVVDLVRNKEKT